MTKLFVGGLPYSFDNQKLNELFTQFGQVTSATVITDKFTNQSKGFGFVEMADDGAAQEAIKALNSSSLEGRTIGVSVARPREERRDPGSFGGNRGNFQRDDFRRGGNNFSRGSGGGGHRR